MATRTDSGRTQFASRDAVRYSEVICDDIARFVRGTKALTCPHMPRASLRAPRLAQHSTRPTLRNAVAAQSIANMLHRTPPLRRAQKFPEAAPYINASFVPLGQITWQQVRIRDNC